MPLVFLLVSTFIFLKIFNVQERVTTKDNLQNATQIYRNLNHIKNNILNYLVFYSENYQLDSKNKDKPQNMIPAPGYVFCPDTNNKGYPDSSCGYDAKFAIGRVPQKINNIRFNIAPPNLNLDKYWLVVDSKYVYNNPRNGKPTNKFVPLNPDNPSKTNLYYDNRDNIVAIIFYSGMPQAGQFQPSNSVHDYLEVGNNNSDGKFYSASFNSLINDVAALITKQEWTDIIIQKLTTHAEKLCSLDINELHWFNACATNPIICPSDNNVINPTLNYVGANWRKYIC